MNKFFDFLGSVLEFILTLPFLIVFFVLCILFMPIIILIGGIFVLFFMILDEFID